MTSPSDKASRDLKPDFVERRQSVRVPLAPLGEDARSTNILTPLVFTTEELEPCAQFPTWQQHVAPLYDVRMPDGVNAEDGFAVTQKVWDLRGMLLIEQTVPPFSYERTAEKVRFSPIDHWQISFLRSGRTWTAVDDRVAENEPGMINIRSFGYPFRGRALATDVVLLIIPVDHFAGLGGMPEACNNATLGGYRAKLLIDFVSTIQAGLDHIRSEDLPELRDALRQIVFDTIAPLVKENDASEHNASLGASLGLMTKARRFIQKNLTSRELTPDALSKELAISRTHLYQLFEGSGGVLNYIRQKRLLAAHEMLADASENRRVSDIAQLFGFDTAANFTRAFTQHFGYSPSNVRKSLSRNDGISDSQSDANRSLTFSTLLRTLATTGA
ncbi:helix-turn-helix domain-containing protein [Brucella anthropi]|uniref:Helix-turn-helix transcriptional regulator n=2 Tax=Brucella anthropi TaxID=529 RepID=A0A011UB22_BRUAN|nr:MULTISPECIES: AraC family transcriptional regulator [Brucella/Ochrobactrum group]QOD66276.1 helix-turn-helix transcriptional regulator [Ochrobactrum sp. MT180101]EXL03301.1 AraC family transcriptional regulator [Brucella anthropi]KAB2756514.1 helix-turn-helix transcriptional regulator [Brucella anthropi]KAB2769994.1 helix-turn-helix transcriptional regulator [Brucella anthropi]KAB2790176.1 helix-turn-helix transcriptional regulator [Brucella anthropi]